MSAAKAAQAERALISAMGEKRKWLIVGSVEVSGRRVSWEEACNSKGTCSHFRTAVAPLDAVDQYFDAVA